jgi:hypothetical protein
MLSAKELKLASAEQQQRHGRGVCRWRSRPTQRSRPSIHRGSHGEDKSPEQAAAMRPAKVAALGLVAAAGLGGYLYLKQSGLSVEALVQVGGCRLRCWEPGRRWGAH